MKVIDSSASSHFFSDAMAWPPGFRFHPTDEELVLYYLKRKICRRRIRLNVIGVTDVHKWEPEDLPGQSLLKTGDRQWFFFSPRDRKYPNGGRSNRATIYGYWKATGKDRRVNYNSRTVGTKKTLVFYRGRAPSGQRTDWVMHEYTVHEEELKSCQTEMDYYALYKLYKKSGPGPKNGEHYGAPFKEEEWADDAYLDVNIKHADKVTALKILPDDDGRRAVIHPGLPSIANVSVDGAVGHVNTTPQVVGDEEITQSSSLLEPSAGGIGDKIVSHIGAAPSFDIARIATSHPHSCEAAKVTSAPNIFVQEQQMCHVMDEDFLEIDDLLGQKIDTPSAEKSGDLFSFEDGMSEFDLYHDAAMFIQEMDSRIVNQLDYELPPPCVCNDQLWTERHPNDKFLLNDIPSPVTGLPGEEKQDEGGAKNWLSTSLWTFVESIPTNPASASENAFVNRMASFSRLSIRANNANDVRRLGGRHYSITKRDFIYFSFLVVAAASIFRVFIKMYPLSPLRSYYVM